LIGLSLVLAFAGSALVLLLSGSLEGEQEGLDQWPDDMVERGVVGQKAAPVLDPVALHDELEDVAQGHEGIYGVALLDPDSGTKISLRGEEQFMAASIGKLPVLATLYRAAAQGELDLEEEIPVLPEDIRDYGDGEIPDVPAGELLTLRESAFRMINHSDNVAWSMLDRRLAADRIREELAEMGIEDSWYSDDLYGYYTTPEDVLVLVEKISDPLFTSEDLSAEMLNDMTDTNLEDRIPEKLPIEVRVAHKTGTYEDNFGDAGVMFYEDPRGVAKRYYLVVLAKGAGEDEVRDAIQSISQVVYEALTGNRVDPAWSRVSPYSSALENEIVEQDGAQDGTTEPYFTEDG
jgi:beta-lactamase class A